MLRSTESHTTRTHAHVTPTLHACVQDIFGELGDTEIDGALMGKRVLRSKM